MEIRPILSAMLRNRTGSVLIALQIAVTFAVVVNALFIISGRLEKMQLPVGTDVDNSFFLRSVAVGEGIDTEQFMRADLRTLRELPGVVSATSTLTYFHSGAARADTFRSVPEINDDMEVLVNVNYADEYGLKTLGATLLAGRFFTAADMNHIGINDNAIPHGVVVTAALADKFFPGVTPSDAVGRQIYYDERAIPVTIMGVISDVATAWLAVDHPDLGDTKYNLMLQPYSIYPTTAYYMVRAEPGQRAAVMAAMEEALLAREPNRLLQSVMTVNEVLARSYANDRATAAVLTVVMVLMVVITGLGIVGLAAFNVRQRTRQIGTRRALGARRRDILRYFFVENVLLTTLGVLLGAVLTYLLNFLLSSQFGGERLAPVYIPGGMLILYSLGLIAVYGPAQRAAAIPPAIATRTV